MRPPLASPDDQSVTFVELFFDLVFVFSVTQVAALLHGHMDLRSSGGALLVFWLVWWAWTQFTWALNAANTDHSRVQAATLLATAVAFLMAVGIGHALTGGALWFAVPYVAVRTIGLLLYYWVARGDPLQRTAVRIFGLLSTSGLAAVLLGAVIGGSWLYAFWALAIAFDLIAAALSGRREGWNLHAGHFVERHGLIVIIALGEALIVAAAGLIDAPRTPAVVALGVLAVAVTCGLWWTYFRNVRPLFERAMHAAQGTDRSRLGRDVFSILHFPLLCGVIAMAAANAEILAHPEEPLTLALRVALGAGAVLFICGTGAAVWRASGSVLPWRWVLAPAAAIALLVAGATPWLAMLLLGAMLAAIGTIEHSRRGAFASDRALESRRAVEAS